MKLEDGKISMALMEPWINDNLKSVTGEVSESCLGRSDLVRFVRVLWTLFALEFQESRSPFKSRKFYFLCRVRGTPKIRVKDPYLTRLNL